MAKKRGAKVSELHSAPRKLNPDVRRRVTVLLDTALVVKLKTKAFEAHTSVQKFVSSILESHLK